MTNTCHAQQEILNSIPSEGIKFKELVSKVTKGDRHNVWGHLLAMRNAGYVHIEGFHGGKSPLKDEVKNELEISKILQ